jgi:hypothetical protein
MQYRKPVFAIDYNAVEISRHGAGAHTRSEKGGYVTTWDKEGVKFCVPSNFNAYPYC